MNVTVIDYGSGNLYSVQKALEFVIREWGLSCTLRVSNDPREIVHADRIVLPGVGSFRGCMRGLQGISGMVEALICRVRRESCPFLGICVGMQLMASHGLEHGFETGLGWIDGHVALMTPPLCGGERVKIPHMGWNQLTAVRAHDVLSAISSEKEGAHAYFIHSYAFVPLSGAEHVVACTMHGRPVTAMIARDNLVGVQFHPEKSGRFGLSLLADFLTWKP
ncbi:MAG: imidazole glycerol phosphate synthase subunit HisH [Alphaproteobacteria bacterium]|nr:imidazole glycerol phosphate synthase subunit HisH [Alphaproteobacteria bacterium]